VRPITGLSRPLSGGRNAVAMTGMGFECEPASSGWFADRQVSGKIIRISDVRWGSLNERPNMGIRNYLIEGGSGTGKTTVAEELERRGHHVVHGDRKLAYYGDPNTGEPMQTPPFEDEVDKVRWGYDHWIWPVESVKTLIADQANALSFFCGHSANSWQFTGLFDGVFILEVDADTLSTRLMKRPEDEFGGKPIERELVMHLHATKEDLPGNASSIEANAPITRVVDEILSKCSSDQPAH
jgi:hypothetical protein